MDRRQVKKKGCCGLTSPLFKLVLEITDPVNSGLKREKDHSDCYQCKVQKPAPVMVWEDVTAQCLITSVPLKGTIHAESYTQGLEQRMLLSKQRLFQRDATKSKTTRVTTALTLW